MLSNKLYACKLYTLDGELPATAKLYGTDRCKISADNGKLSIIVNQSLAERKFWDDECPLFYAC